MRYAVLSVALFCLILAACHRPVAYFQRTPYTSARTLLPPPELTSQPAVTPSLTEPVPSAGLPPMPASELVASAQRRPSQTPVRHRITRMASVLTPPITTAPTSVTQPKPQKSLRLGNKIRQSLGMPLRKELTWWQRISWKLKASVVVILVAVVFAILNITILAIIFGVLGAFLLITGLKKSFKTRRPWF